MRTYWSLRYSLSQGIEFSFYKYLCIGVAVALSSCNFTGKSEKDDDINCLIDSYNIDLENGFIVTIPTYGCSGCRESVIEFSKTMPENDEIYFFIYGEMNKTNRLLYGDLVSGNRNIFFDSLKCVQSRNVLYPELITVTDRNQSLVVPITSDTIHEVLKTLRDSLDQ